MQHLIREFDETVEEYNDTVTYAIGDFVIVKMPTGLFNVNLKEEVFFENLTLLSAAVALASLLHRQEYDTAKQVLFLEQKFAKHYSSMCFFANASRYDLFENEKIDAEWCLRKIQTYILLPN